MPAYALTSEGLDFIQVNPTKWENNSKRPSSVSGAQREGKKRMDALTQDSRSSGGIYRKIKSRGLANVVLSRMIFRLREYPTGRNNK